jgi:phosphonate transport system substrate-binding protein
MFHAKRTTLRGLVLLAALLVGAGLRPAWGAEAPLVFGVFPHLTARQLLVTYRPLAAVLEKRLGRPVLVYSARDFRTFIARTRAGEYDLLLTAPHLAWLARQEAGYRPLLKYSEPVHALLLTRTDSKLAAMQDLRDRVVAVADEIALATLAIELDLTAEGLERDRDYRTLPAVTPVNAMTQLLAGRADAAIVGTHPFKMLPAEKRAQLRVVARTHAMSSLTYLAHPRLSDDAAQGLREGLLEFAASPAGREFLAKGGFGTLVEADDSELAAFRPHALRTQALLRAAP